MFLLIIFLIIFIIFTAPIIMYKGINENAISILFTIIATISLAAAVIAYTNIIIDDTTQKVTNDIRTNVLNYLTYTGEITLEPIDSSFYYKLNDSTKVKLYNYLIK